MAQALSLGARGLGRVWPRPSVGCVLVRGTRIVGRGVTDAATGDHGEVVALRQAGALARGATAYVTLEPCSHHGRTPPCSDALVTAGVARVVAALEDPNPAVSGAGLSRLRAAGVEVSLGVGAGAARRQLNGFLHLMKFGRPAVTLKLATSFDGRIATASGESRWITGPAARRVVHGLRMRHDAVLVGAGTARADNPTLTVRDMGTTHQPVRVVASRRLNLPWPNRLADTIQDGPVWILHGQDDAKPSALENWQRIGAKTLPVAVEGQQLDMGAALRALGNEGITRVFCEGGGAMAASLLAAGLVDDLIVFTAGFAFGAEGQPAIGAMGLSALSDAERFDLVETRGVGADVMQYWEKRAD
jgi:diaminohydroxyphosphoribosylaminopyrimidine deaminase/5-amino-6-(5-phosphoribosylamino)uracil reductase